MTELAEQLELRKFHDGTYSVIARIWTPEKRFYEHPTFINLTEEETSKHCQTLLTAPPTIQEVQKSWVLIGN